MGLFFGRKKEKEQEKKESSTPVQKENTYYNENEAIVWGIPNNITFLRSGKKFETKR